MASKPQLNPQQEPDFVVCTQCDTPCFQFEWDFQVGRLREAFCAVCGNDELDEFQAEVQFYDGVERGDEADRLAKNDDPNPQHYEKDLGDKYA